MNWTTPKIIGLVLAASVVSSVVSSVCTSLVMRRIPPPATAATAQKVQAAIQRKQYPPPDPQALADLENQVLDLGLTKHTFGEVTINLRPYVNSPLTAPLADEPDQKDHTLAELPTGVHIYGGVPFDVQGIIQLNSPSIKKGLKLWPLEVPGIAIGYPFKKLHLLHGAFNIETPAKHTVFAKLILHYEDGSQQALSLAGGTHALRCVGTWIPAQMDLLPTPQTELAWMGSNPYLKQNSPGEALHLYRTTLDNPNPETKVTSIDYLSPMNNPGPFLAGLTIE